ncbi:MAG TPA: ATP-binding protein [Oscillospiraceae bacterium]|nr:ATP-binding protein [Oscillospiraceae bacterium]
MKKLKRSKIRTGKNKFIHSKLYHQEVNALFECVNTVFTNVQFDDAVRKIYDIAKRIIGNTVGFAAELNEERTTNNILFLDSAALPFRVPVNVPLPVDGLHAYAYQTDRIFYENNFATSKWVKDLPASHLPFENLMVIPLTYAEQTAGLLGLVNKPGGFTEHDVVLATIFAEFASLTLSKKHLLEELAASEDKYKSLVEILPEAILIHKQGKIIFTNAIASELLGVTDGSSLEGKSILRYLLPEDKLLFAKKCIATKKLPINLMERSVIREDKQIITVETSTANFKYNGDNAEIFVFRDITARKKLQEETLIATKLEAINILAGGIAHDFNNILTVILGNLSMAKMLTASGTEIEDRLKEIETAALQTKELTRQLLTFAKGNPLIKKQASLAEILQEMITFALRGTNVEPFFNFAEQLPAVAIDIGQFGQVVNNLVINAVQAMPHGGQLYLQATLEHLTNYSGLLAPGDYVKVSFTDTGVGISSLHLPQIFDPFFTTKEQGNGLGLVTSYHIIKQHGGQITVESELGKGSTFHLYLPAAHEKVTPEPEEMTIVHGYGKILLMDDEYGVRKTACEMLNLLGYEPDWAKNGEEAFTRYLRAQQSGTPYDLVILDMTVRGGMGGQEAMEALLQIDPQVKAIIATGYTTAPLITDYKKYGFSGYIYKPFRLEELSSALNKLLTAHKE